MFEKEMNMMNMKSRHAKSLSRKSGYESGTSTRVVAEA